MAPCSQASLEEGLNGSDSHTPLLGRPPVQHLQGSLHRIRRNRLVDAVLTVLFSNYINVLLIFLPLGIISGALGWSPPMVFAFNFLAIMPLASLLSFATEELSKKVGQTIGGLLNASFGNATELIVSIVALKEGQIRLVQASMLGSILSNLLLVVSLLAYANIKVLGCCFVIGGIRFPEQTFNDVVAQAMSSLMFVATGSLILPAAFQAALPHDHETREQILALSRGTSIVLLIIYLLYLFFQLKTHAHLYDEAAGEAGEDEPAAIGPYVAAATLVLITVAIAICSEYLVDSIDEVVQESGISKTFIGLILLPIVGNAGTFLSLFVVNE